MEKVIKIDNDKLRERLRKESAFWGSRLKDESEKAEAFSRIAIMPEDEELFTPIINLAVETLENISSEFRLISTDHLSETIESYVCYCCLSYWFAIVMPECEATVAALAENTLSLFRSKASCCSCTNTLRPLSPF